MSIAAFSKMISVMMPTDTCTVEGLHAANRQDELSYSALGCVFYAGEDGLRVPAKPLTCCCCTACNVLPCTLSR